jgi:hypothetical protein
MAFVSSSFSNRKLQNRRFTSDALTLSVEAFTDTLDLSAGEIYTDDGLIPSGSSQLPYSGSDQDGFIVSGSVVDSTLAGSSDVDILKYYYRKKLTVGANASRDTFYVLSTDPATATTTVADIGGSDQIISDDQLTNFISPKYIVAVDATNNAETDATPGYEVVISAGTSAGTATPINKSKYVFDYKTGVLSFIDASDVGGSDFVFISAYQYIGRTLRSQIDDGSIGGGGDIGELNTFSGSMEASASAGIYFSGSLGGGFSVPLTNTASFAVGNAGISVVAVPASNTIRVGDNTDNIHFNDISASGNFVLNGTSQITSPNLDSTGQEYGNVDLATIDVYNDFWNVPVGTFKAHGLRVGSGSYTNASDEQFSLLQLGTNYIIGGSGATDTQRAGLNFILSGSGNQGTTHKLRFFADDAGNEILRFGYNDFLIKGTDDVDSDLSEKGLEFNSSDFKIYSGSGTSTVFTVSRQTKAATFAGEVTATGGFVGDLEGTASFASKVVLSKATNTAARPIILSSGATPNGQLAYASGSNLRRFTYNPFTATLEINGGNTADALSITTSSLYVGSSITSYDLLNTNVTTLNFGGAATNINMGASNGTVTIAGSASIAGDLIVQGTTTSIQTANLNVEDQFILLASGSTGTKDGGIIVQSGSNGVGTALYFDADANRWAVNPVNSVNWNDTAVTPKQYVVSVSASAASPTTTPQDFGSTNEYYGMMHVNTDNGEIWIYS